MAELLDRPATLGPFDKSKKGTWAHSTNQRRAQQAAPIIAIRSHQKGRLVSRPYAPCYIPSTLGRFSSISLVIVSRS